MVTFALQWTVRESIMGMCPASFSWGEYTLLTQLLCLGFRATVIVCLVAFWALNCAATFFYVRLCQSWGQPLTTVHRKFFHVTVTLVAVSGFLFDPVFTMISSWAAMNLLCCALRALKVGKVGPAIDAVYGSFLDRQDCGFLILTPIYLLMHFSGVISVGVGDALASVFGYKWGRAKLPSSRKTLLGLLMNVVGQIVSTILTIYTLCSWDGEYAVRLLAGPWLVAMMEAYSVPVDNLVLPLCYILVMGQNRV
ncbi:hypothetical protein TTRE_0000312401 [Trichuris trichiura]|uniref:dolichol kinase n=1 Tax=Trichuris trichiura TaxID=36087 RepID=A0A077Z4T3_TRITR|nr:hypothetical protein TTRE_0000312401 [Trichuris trichiura]